MSMLKNDENVFYFRNNPFENFKSLCKKYASSKRVMAARLTMDISPMMDNFDYFKNIIITIWHHKDEGIPKGRFSWKDFKDPCSFLSSELTKSFSYHWRQKIYKKIWEEIEENKEIKNPLEITVGERQKKQCELYINKWHSSNLNPFYSFLFDLVSIAKVKDKFENEKNPNF